MAESTPTHPQEANGTGRKLEPDYLEQITLRSIADAAAAATRHYWHRRADTLDAARPKPGDYTGQATQEQLGQQWRRLTTAAEQCRAHATLLEHDTIDVALLADLLGWPAADIITQAITGDSTDAGGAL